MNALFEPTRDMGSRYNPRRLRPTRQTRPRGCRGHRNAHTRTRTRSHAHTLERAHARARTHSRAQHTQTRLNNSTESMTSSTESMTSGKFLNSNIQRWKIQKNQRHQWQLESSFDSNIQRRGYWYCRRDVWVDRSRARR